MLVFKVESVSTHDGRTEIEIDGKLCSIAEIERKIYCVLVNGKTQNYQNLCKKLALPPITAQDFDENDYTPSVDGAPISFTGREFNALAYSKVRKPQEGQEELVNPDTGEKIVSYEHEIDLNA